MKRNAAFYGIALSLALVLSTLERMLVIPGMMPGIKLGLANVVVLMLLYLKGVKAAAAVSLLRVILSAALYGGLSSFFFGFAGALASFLVMALFFARNALSPVGVSVLGGVAHNAGQLAVAACLVETGALLYYLPVLLVSGVITGIATGYIAKAALPVLGRFSPR